MRSIVVYATRSGNTRTIAEAIAEGLRDEGPVAMLAAEDVGPALPAGTDLVVVGGPTEGHGLTPAATAALDRLGAALDGVAAAAFDTRLRWPRWLSGSAASKITDLLLASGARLIAEPESFFVTRVGPALEDDEAERAAEWGRGLPAAVHASAPTRPYADGS